MEEVDVCNNWEDLDDENSEVFERQLERLRLQRTKGAINSENGVSIVDTKGSLDTVVILDSTREDSLRSQPLTSEPKISILTRPKNVEKNTAQFNGIVSNGPSGIKNQAKTLEQREKEYAEARKRILGDVQFEEEEAEARMEEMLSPADILKLKVAKTLKGEDISSVNLLKSVSQTLPTTSTSTSSSPSGPPNNNASTPPNKSGGGNGSGRNSVDKDNNRQTSPKKSRSRKGNRGVNSSDAHIAQLSEQIRELSVPKYVADRITREPRGPIPGTTGFNQMNMRR